MLFRLETALKDFFQLREMRVPDAESDLRWSLNRFLAAASKKHPPARIVIIVDCVHRLVAEGVPDGSLHWLPIDLPPRVRFIISTIENEHSKTLVNDTERLKHKTFIELNRRGYPFLKMDKISVPTCNLIIEDYVKLNSGEIELSVHQAFKIVTAPAAIENPMFLRSLLQSLRLSKLITSASIDDLLESFLRCTSAYELIDKCLNVCNDFIVQEYTTYSPVHKLLGNVFTVLYASRNGLTALEIWGILEILSRSTPPKDLQRKVFTILEDFTMIVNDLLSFSHKIYREVVYSKYVMSDENLKKWHLVMARYFGELEPCPRKIVALPHHLEFAGAWSKVKNCLTDIDMFRIWWERADFRKEFLKLWASLTTRDHAESTVTRPSFDIVEEYVKSLDEYRDKKRPKDEDVADIILLIGEFLIEFASLGYEEGADVPALFHPLILAEDLKSIGVPYLELETDGKNGAILRFPKVYDGHGQDDEKAVMENPKAFDELPICSTYFYNRWMWIQFPYVALGNCGLRYHKGMEILKSEISRGVVRDTTVPFEERTKFKRVRTSADTLRPQERQLLEQSRMLSQSLPTLEVKSVDTSKLPEIKFVRRAARTLRKIPAYDTDSSNAVVEAYNQRMESLRDEVQTYRDEHDFVMQIKFARQQRLHDLKGQLAGLLRSGESVTAHDNELAAAAKREEEAREKAEVITQINRNLQNLYLVCERHPPNVPALINELNFKLDQDSYLIQEIKSRLWKQKFEMGSHVVTVRDAKRLLQKTNEMRNKLISQREEVKVDLERQHNKDAEELLNSSGKRSPNTKGHAQSQRLIQKSQDEKESMGMQSSSWTDDWSKISSRTGVMEPEVFFQRYKDA